MGGRALINAARERETRKQPWEWERRRKRRGTALSPFPSPFDLLLRSLRRADEGGGGGSGGRVKEACEDTGEAARRDRPQNPRLHVPPHSPLPNPSCEHDSALLLLLLFVFLFFPTQLSCAAAGLLLASCYQKGTARGVCDHTLYFPAGTAAEDDRTRRQQSGVAIVSKHAGNMKGRKGGRKEEVVGR